MKKDKVIEKRLIEYVEANKPGKERMIGKALAFMQQSKAQSNSFGYYQQGQCGEAYPQEAGMWQTARQQDESHSEYRQRRLTSFGDFSQKMTGRRRLATLGGLAAVILAVVVLSLVVNGLFKAGSGILEMKDLSSEFVTLDEAQDLTKQTLNLDLKDIDPSLKTSSYKVFSSENGKIEAVSAKHKIVTEHGTDEILIIADFTQKISDYKDERNMRETFSDGVKGIEKYENGEYVTTLYFVENETDFFVFVLSPAQGSANKYLVQIKG